MADIMDLIEGYRDGLLLMRLNSAYSELVEACEDQELGGSLTMKVDLKPKGDGVYAVHASVTSKTPQPQLKPAMFFSDGAGNLARRDARQTDIEDFTGDDTVTPLNRT
ncbi:MAG: hypothetical protein QNI84_13285 [Henriciella sp.]|nr:hypothetical protein [Henriciella sp.]